ncbi:ribonuclease H-like domain-containing protein [Penicillium manginii]|jgi:ribonuclease HI|uniref:ribonuclease H-like domain-containing protein n=1 Tax=Penicillium manginii TaxID=203109 RepID=UPI002549B494|nr:ribonuclease H-like domain-containing protein [Penicillium manginii]KAJ5763747.1 ribonuclease H-like domain-containing protein [Penicillium manginii]
MVYTMKIYTDGGCRGNGSQNAIGAAAAVLMRKWGSPKSWVRPLNSWPTPTSQRAELEAIILALQKALEVYEGLGNEPVLDVTIYSDSRYAVNCMTKWIYKWIRNGWINCAGDTVANQDLLEKASDLDDRLREEGVVEYVWIPREQNELADKICDENMDNQKKELEYYDSDSDSDSDMY